MLIDIESKDRYVLVLVDRYAEPTAVITEVSVPTTKLSRTVVNLYVDKMFKAMEAYKEDRKNENKYS